MTTAILEKVSFDFPVEVLKQVEENGEFHVVGYAATTDFDLQGDIITEDALKAAADDLLKNSTVLLNHDIKQPIGKVTKAQFDKNGLLIDALISQTEPDIIQKVKEGVLNKFSIRGEVLERESKFIPSLDRVANVIKKMTLIEVSLVSVPANPEARAVGWYVSKALQDAETHSQGGAQIMKKDTAPEEKPPQDPEKPGEAAASPDPQDPNKGDPTPEPEEQPPAGDVEKTLSSLPREGVEPVFKLLDQMIALGGQAKPMGEQAKALLKQMIENPAPTPVPSPAPPSVTKEEVAQLISTEVQKQLATALKAVPTVRKGLVPQGNEAEDVRKTFDSLPPERKLRVALALQQN